MTARKRPRRLTPARTTATPPPPVIPDGATTALAGRARTAYLARLVDEGRPVDHAPNEHGDPA